MTSFVQDLWESVFTPGPTPTLLVVTNATFAALQLILAVLLAGTRSIHFAVLSVLCGGLWWAVNWFARELMVHQAHEQAKEEEKLVPVGQGTAATEDEADQSETEVEGGSGDVAGLASSGMSSIAGVPDPIFTLPPADSDAGKGKALEREASASASASTSASAETVKTAATTTTALTVATGVEDHGRGELKQRRDAASQDTQSSASTEDEWEKVSENEGNRFQ